MFSTTNSLRGMYEYTCTTNIAGTYLYFCKKYWVNIEVVVSAQSNNTIRKSIKNQLCTSISKGSETSMRVVRLKKHPLCFESRVLYVFCILRLQLAFFHQPDDFFLLYVEPFTREMIDLKNTKLVVLFSLRRVYTRNSLASHYINYNTGNDYSTIRCLVTRWMLSGHRPHLP